MIIHELRRAQIKRMIADYHVNKNARAIIEHSLMVAQRLGADDLDIFIFRELYIEKHMTTRQLSEKHFMCLKSVYKSANRIINKYLIPLVFGIEGIQLEGYPFGFLKDVYAPLVDQCKESDLEKDTMEADLIDLIMGEIAKALNTPRC